MIQNDGHMFTEESIRFNVIKMLVENYGYSQEEIVSEVPLNGRKPVKADIVIYKPGENRTPLITIELKSRPINPSVMQDFLLQYRDVETKYLMLTNGIDKVCYRLVDGKTIELPDIPRKGEEKITLSRSMLKKAETLENVFWNIMNYMRASKLSEDDTIREINKLILCKITDETSRRSLKFTVNSSNEIGHAASIDKVSIAINELFENAKEKYPDFFEKTERIKIEPAVLEQVVSALQSYSLTMTDPEIVCNSYDMLLSRSMKRIGGSSFNPQEIVGFLVNLANPTPRDCLLDPFCGSGNFILSAMLHVWQQIERQTVRNDDRRINKKNYASSMVFGFDPDQRMIFATKIKLLLYSGGPTHISQKSLFSIDVAEEGTSVLKNFDLVIGKLPMGFSIDSFVSEIKDRREYKKRSLEEVYLEKCFRLLKRGGRMAVIVPENLLFSGRLSHLRTFLLREGLVKAIVSLPVGAFLQYGTSVKTSILLIEKPAKNCERGEYEIFMAELHDPNSKRHQPVSIEQNLKAVLGKYGDFRNGCFTFSSNPLIFSIRSTGMKSIWSVGRYATLGEKNILPAISDSVSLKSSLSVCNETFFSSSFTKCLEEISSVSRGILIRSENSSDGPKTSDWIPYVRIGDMQNGTLSKTNFKYVLNDKQKFAGSIARPGDLLYSVRGTIGKVASVPEIIDKIVASSQVAIIRVDKHRVNADYLSIVLSSSCTRDQAESLTSGSIIRYLSLNDLRKIKVPIPSMNEQLEIVRKVRDLQNKDTQLLRERETLRQQIDDLLGGTQR